MNKMKDIKTIGKITQYFVSQRHLAWLLSIVLVVMGSISFSSMAKESLPEIVFPTLIVQTSYLGASASDVENLVTIPIENKIRNIGSVDDIQSSSISNFSVVTVFFEEDVDIEKAQTDVLNRLSQVNFPDGVETPNVTNFTTSEIPLLTFTLSDNAELTELTAKAEDLRNEVLQIRGVSDVILRGAIDQEIVIKVDEEELLKYGIGYFQIQEAINSTNVSFPVGSVEIGGRKYKLSVDESLKTIDSIRNVIINTPFGEPIAIKDFATVELAYSAITETNKTYTRDDGLKNSVFFQVIREKQSDVLGTSEQVKSIVDQFSSDQSLSYSYLTDLSENVKKDLDNIQDSALSGFAVVIIILFLFIGFKESLIAAFSIPLSLLITLTVLQLLGVTLNTFVILGLIVSLGLLVDNSIIVIENIERWRKMKKHSKEAAIMGTNEVALPIVASTSTTVAAFFPLAILPGIIGAFINTIPRTIIITLLASLVVSLTVVPTLYSYLKMGKQRSKWVAHVGKALSVLIVASLSSYAFIAEGISLTLSLPIIIALTLAMVYKQYLKKANSNDGGLMIKYQGFLLWILSKGRRQISVIIIGVLVVALSFSTFSLGLLKVSFFPSAEANSATVTITVPSSTSIDETSQVIENVEKLFVNNDLVDSFTTTIGGSKEEEGVLILKLNTENENHSNAIQLINNKLKEVPGIVYTVEGAAGQGPPVGKPIVIKLENNNLDELSNVVDQVQEGLKDIPGVINVESSKSQSSSDLMVEVDFDKASKYQLTAWAIIQQLNIKVSGAKLSTAVIGGQEFEIMMRYSKEGYSSLDELSSTSLVTPRGEIIPMSLIATPVERTSISQINRQDGVRYMTISADLLSGYNAFEVIDTLKENVGSLDIGGTNILYEGEVAGVNDSFTNLFISMILAVFLVFAILTIQMKSLVQPFVILMTVPMALVGVIWGLVVTGNDFGFYAFMGVVSLVGIAVNDAIVLIDFMNKSRQDGMNIKDAIGRAVSIRFNPVIATTLTTIGGVLPLAFRDVYYEQFSYALIFGLLVTTVLTLLFIPILYFAIENVKRRFKRQLEEV